MSFGTALSFAWLLLCALASLSFCTFALVLVFARLWRRSCSQGDSHADHVEAQKTGSEAQVDWTHIGSNGEAQRAGTAQPQVLQGGGAVRKVWPSQWGITLAQCKAFLAECQAHPEWRSENSLYTLVKDYVKPRTAGSGLGLALLLNQQQPLEVNVMVSHAWCENVEEFVRTLELTVSDDDVLFICAFSLYQCEDFEGPSILEQLGSTAAESPFHQVLQNIGEVGRKEGLLWRYSAQLRSIPTLFTLVAMTLLFAPTIRDGCLPMVDADMHVICCHSTNVFAHKSFSLGAFEGSWYHGPDADAWYETFDRRVSFPLALTCAACALLVASAVRLSGVYRGRMVVVPNRECDLYSRLWCVYEIFVARATDVPVALAQTLARAGGSGSRSAVCGSPEDMRRIRGEIEAYGERVAGQAEQGYALVDKSITRTTKSTRQRLLVPLILHNWPVMLVQVGLLRVCVLVPVAFHIRWAVCAVASFILSFAVVASVLYFQAKQEQGRICKVHIRRAAVLFSIVGLLWCVSMWLSVRYAIPDHRVPDIMPLLLVGTTFLLSGVSLLGLLALERVIHCRHSAHLRLADRLGRASALVQFMLIGLGALGVATSKHTPTLSFYGILLFTFLGFPAAFITAGSEWDIRLERTCPEPQPPAPARAG